jgi:cellulose synthase/poly-beta-1,6-N-acetylglucosamine synthase-like glycosyltransferase
MTLITILFWALATLIVYTYLGYGLLLFGIIRLKKEKEKKKAPMSEFPSVTLLIAAYNERDYLHEKVANCLALKYPKHKLSVWFVTDGSNDGSELLLNQYEELKVFHQAKRAGKMAAINRIIPQVNSDLVVFTDANTMLNEMAILELVRPFEDASVGCVAGEKRIAASDDNTASQGESFYWKYESALKKWNAQWYSTIGAAGELYAIRTELYQAPKADTILDDFIVSQNAVDKGYKIAYTSAAYALESGSLSLEEEMKRKVRICAGGIQAVWRTKHLLNPFRNARFAFQYFSHRVLRWTITPLALVAVFFINLVLVMEASPIYILTLLFQLTFWSLALIGWGNRQNGLTNKLLLVPCYFMMMNWAVFLGFKRYWMGQQSVLWEQAKRG